MRIRKRPPQIPAPGLSDPVAVGVDLVGASAGEAAGTGGEVRKGEPIMGTGGLHPSVEARGKGGRPWSGDSAVSWRLGRPEEGNCRGSLTAGSSDGSCFVELQVDGNKGKEEADGGFGTKEESKDRKQPAASAGAAQLTVVAHKAWNHSASGGGLHSSSAAAAAVTDGLGAEALVSATVTLNDGNRSELGCAARKRRNIVWSNSISRSARSPSLFSSSEKTDISNGGVMSYMHGNGDHQLVKVEHQINGKEQMKQQQVVYGGGNRTSNKKNNSGKRRRSPAVLMEGSRCSRVNGRGWRCCQQTLVGYSLCEHHLGKGRLRSVSSVKCKKAGGRKQSPNQPVNALQQHHDHRLRWLATIAPVQDDDEDYDEETKPVVGKKRGKRIVTVKARSISSLLCQTSSDVISHPGVAANEVAPMIATAATLAGLSTAIFRSPDESSSATPAAATVMRVSCEGSAAAAGVAAPLLPTTAAHQEGISAVM